MAETKQDTGVEQHPHLRRNFTLGIINGGLFVFAEALMSIDTVLTWFVQQLGGSNFLIGLVGPMRDAGWFLPQLFLASHTERLPRKLPLVLFLGFLERVPYVVLPLAVLWLGGHAGQWALAVFIFLMAWKSIGGGISAVPWQELMAKIIPMARRGRFFGTSQSIGQLLGIAGAALAVALLSWLPYPSNFAASFGVGAVGTSLSLVFAFQTREPPSALPPAAEQRRQLADRQALEAFARGIDTPGLSLANAGYSAPSPRGAADSLRHLRRIGVSRHRTGRLTGGPPESGRQAGF